MKENVLEMEHIIEKELMMPTNIKFKDVADFMANNVVIDKYEYSELLKDKHLVDTKYVQLQLEYDNKMAIENRRYNELRNSFNDVCKQRDELQVSVNSLNNKITDLEKQINKLKQPKKKWWIC